MEPDACATALVAAVDALLAQDPSTLPGAVALGRARTILTQVDRLNVVLGSALVDVQNRELFALDGAGSAGGWLRQQPGGDGSRMTRATRLKVRAKVRAAVATGALGVAAADVVCRALEQLPTTAEPGQVEGVLTGAVPELLSRWTAGPGSDPDVAEARAAVVAEVIAHGVGATALAPAERLEAAFTLIGQALSCGVLAEQLQLIIDALQPERLDSAEAQTYDERELRLRKKRSVPGWRITGHLTDEVGAALHAEFEARARARKTAQAKLAKARAEGSTAAKFGTVGPGSPTPTDPSVTDRPGEGDGSLWDTPVELTDGQLAHDLLGEILDDLADPGTGLRPTGQPRPAQLTITAGLDLLEGRLGTLPGTTLLPGGPAPITLAAVRRAGCDGVLNAVLLDAARNPVGASGNHRHATERERRALRAKWGDYCAGDGCGSTRTVPHHVRPWYLTGTTRVEDLIPLCNGEHHDVHDGHRTIRLRDGRMINEYGWVTPPGTAPPEPYPDEPGLWTPLER